MTLVIDASMALAWMFACEKPEEAASADLAIQATTEMATIVPSLWHTEVANALLVGERRKIITEAQSIDFLARLARLPITVEDLPTFSRRDQVMALARHYELTAYDATYLELAGARGQFRHCAIIRNLSDRRNCPRLRYLLPRLSSIPGLVGFLLESVSFCSCSAIILGNS